MDELSEKEDIEYVPGFFESNFAISSFLCQPPCAQAKNTFNALLL
jgi:hypothetical protein